MIVMMTIIIIIIIIIIMVIIIIMIGTFVVDYQCLLVNFLTSCFLVNRPGNFAYTMV